MATALIIGITGQDGLYLAEHLLARDYEIVGVTRDVAQATSALPHSLAGRITLEWWNLATQRRVDELFAQYKPKLAFNFAALASGAGMHANPVAMGKINGIAVTHILEAIRLQSPNTRFCQASSAEMFGEPASQPQNEATHFNPRSPYGAAKLYAHSMVGLYRRNYDLHLSSAILFNHESPLRSLNFVTRHVTSTVAKIKLGLVEQLLLGNLESRRDWGFAGDSVRAMHLMTEAKMAEDFVVATGKTHSVEDLCRIAFSRVGLNYKSHIGLDAEAFRPAEKVQLVGDAAKINEKLGWQPAKTFEQTIQMMVDADLDALR